MPRLALLFRLPTRLHRRVRRNRMATLAALAALALVVVLPVYSAYCVYKPPRFVMEHLRARYPDVLFEEPGAGPDKVVALSLDDAPSRYTADIMAALRESEARATFFVIGAQVRGREAALRSLVRAGHELANHAMHDEPSRALTDEQLERDLGQVKAMLVAAYEAEGTYGTIPDATRYDTVVLVAGGNGASFTFGVALDLLSRLRSDDRRHIVFIWAVKYTSCLDWFRHHLVTLETDGRVSTMLFVTRESPGPTSSSKLPYAVTNEGELDPEKATALCFVKGWDEKGRDGLQTTRWGESSCVPTYSVRIHRHKNTCINAAARRPPSPSAQPPEAARGAVSAR
ncbi:carbohydrate esterase family 4 protein [Ophiocordyceps sinensis CO18]|uniref:chitin deacetylase n=1 Tax=Ophiocordyceps sinensis (strain Co18 / CGMCC 3.14243) TaxID=911162 RepID=T5A5A0_OPHSC|nr:carbohydrate esterase family 4 protein [Ophiocordyceps sinensis CO18]